MVNYLTNQWVFSAINNYPMNTHFPSSAFQKVELKFLFPHLFDFGESGASA